MIQTEAPALRENENHRSGFVALIGAPNAGKSTLLNQVVGTKVSIVTHKVQTTRATIRGIVSQEAFQIVFIDTPGIFEPKRRLDEAMVTTAWGGAREADIVCYLVDAKRGMAGDIEAHFKTLQKIRTPKILLLNKIDLIRRDSLLELSQKLNDLHEFSATFMLSATKGDGCEDFISHVGSLLPLGPKYYPDDQLSDFPLRQMSAEVTREKLYLRLHQELPYASHVETEDWKDREDGSVEIRQVIYVERDSQKKIVIGKSGSTIKSISKSSREELAYILDRKVHLFLFVKVRENWGNDPERFREIGLEFPSR